MSAKERVDSTLHRFCQQLMIKKQGGSYLGLQYLVFFLWIGVTRAIYKISGKISSAKDWLMTELKGLDKMLRLFLKIVTGILVEYYYAS